MSFSFLHESESVVFSAAQITNLVCRHRRLGGVTTAFFWKHTRYVSTSGLFSLQISSVHRQGPWL